MGCRHQVSNLWLDRYGPRVNRVKMAFRTGCLTVSGKLIRNASSDGTL